MPARKKISPRQAELLVEFAEAHPDIALCRFPGGPQANQVARRAWDTLAVQLNAIADGSIKTPEQWRRYWIEFKSKTKNKAADCRRDAAATGGGPNKLVPLNELELRVMALVGPVAVEGLPGVRVPISIPPEDDPAGSVTDPIPSTSSIPSTIPNIPIPQASTPGPSMSPEPQMDVEWLEEIPSPSEVMQQSEPQEVIRSQPLEPQVVERDAFQPPVAPRPVTPRPVTPVEPQPEIEVPATARNPQQPARRLSQASRSQRQIRRDERVPRWAYDLEMRRIAAEERFAAAQERLAAAMEATVELMRDIRDAVHNYIRSNS